MMKSRRTPFQHGKAYHAQKIALQNIAVPGWHRQQQRLKENLIVPGELL
jgi:hypothetical protein